MCGLNDFDKIQRLIRGGDVAYIYLIQKFATCGTMLNLGDLFPTVVPYSIRTQQEKQLKGSLY